MISGYRLMWLMVLFDLPVLTSIQRREYRRFVDKLEDNGFIRIQFSIYVRPSGTEESAAKHAARVERSLPPEGEVRLIYFTDKQWARTLVFTHGKRDGVEAAPAQFAFFDADGEVLPEAATDEDSDEPPAPKSDPPGPAPPKLPRRPLTGKRRPPRPTQTTFEFFD